MQDKKPKSIVQVLFTEVFEIVIRGLFAKFVVLPPAALGKICTYIGQSRSPW